jgi:hypothetical protein
MKHGFHFFFGFDGMSPVLSNCISARSRKRGGLKKYRTSLERVPLQLAAPRPAFLVTTDRFMNDAAENATPGTQPSQDETERMRAITQGLSSLSDWAEFSSLIRKLDEEYVQTLAAPLPYRVEEPKRSDI